MKLKKKRFERSRFEVNTFKVISVYTSTFFLYSVQTAANHKLHKNCHLKNIFSISC